MVIVVDTREQKPLVFGCDWLRKKLPVGDYGAEIGGVLHSTIFERKSIGDLFGTLTFGYDRFRREIAKADQLNIALIIAIEGSKEKVLAGYKHSARDPQSIIKQLETINTKYGVKHIFFNSRISMAHGIHDYYLVEEEQLNSTLNQR